MVQKVATKAMAYKMSMGEQTYRRHLEEYRQKARRIDYLMSAVSQAQPSLLISREALPVVAVETPPQA